MKISACIIAKDEEKNLPRLLKSLKGKFDEIILVDTGSTDRTVEIAKEYGCKVYEKEWKGFSDARNFASSKATGDWIWHFDADFELEDEEYKKAIFYLKNIPEDYDAAMISIKNLDYDGTVKAISSQIFIHRNKPHIKWVGKVHECVNVDKSYGIPVFVKHYGYEDETVLKRKAKRNLELLLEEINSIDKNSKTYLFKLFYIVQSYIVLSQTEKNSEYIEQIFKHFDEYRKLRSTLWKDESIKLFDYHMYIYAITSALQINDFDKAEELINEIVKEDTDYPDLLFYSSIVKKHKKKFKESMEDLLKFFSQLDSVSKNPFSSGKNKLTESINRIQTAFYTLQENLKNLNNIEIEKIMEKAKKTFKKSKGIYTGLAYYYILKEKNPELSVNFLMKLSKMFNSEEVYLELSLVFLTAGNIEKAKVYLKRGFDVNPKNININLLLADIYYVEKDLEKALFHYKNYLEITGDISIKNRVKEIIEKIRMQAV